MNAIVRELIRQRESIRHDKYELSEAIEELHEQFEYCPEEHEDAISAEIDAKQELYDELSVMEGMLVDKIDKIRWKC
jgi:hypothetical protein